jgi:allophanate hydrolase subunit 2
MTPDHASATRAPALEVLDPGLLTLVQDLGRPGWAHVGVGRSGAADVGALRAANAAVGNAEDAAGLEILLGGLRLRARGDVLIALTGAPLPLSPAAAGPESPSPVVESTRPPRVHTNEPVLSASARDLGGWVRVVQLADGQELALGGPERGLRTYLAVRGGIGVEPVLGSRASDRLGGIGPASVAAGDVLPVGTGSSAPDEPPLRAVRDTRDEPARAGDGAAAGGAVAAESDDEVVVLRVEPGPHAHWFDDRWPAVLCAPDGYTVLPASDRVAVRLDGPPLTRARGFVGRELAPVGLVPGAVQVPPDGRPVLFGVDHPVTGGYPVVAVVRPDDVDRLAQVRPGDAVLLALTLDR